MPLGSNHAVPIQGRIKLFLSPELDRWILNASLPPAEAGVYRYFVPRGLDHQTHYELSKSNLQQNRQPLRWLLDRDMVRVARRARMNLVEYRIAEYSIIRMDGRMSPFVPLRNAVHKANRWIDERTRMFVLQGYLKSHTNADAEEWVPGFVG